MNPQFQHNLRITGTVQEQQSEAVEQLLAPRFGNILRGMPDQRGTKSQQ